MARTGKEALDPKLPKATGADRLTGDMLALRLADCLARPAWTSDRERDALVLEAAQRLWGPNGVSTPPELADAWYELFGGRS
jgi:hypothetical protein